MKKFLTLLVAIAAAAAASAQTPEEILSRMENEMNKHENDGISMIIDVKMPIIGTVSTTTYFLGDNTKMEANVQGHQVLTWIDKTSQWIYNSEKNEVEITRLKSPSSAESDVEMFSGIAEGYDLSISKETEKAWYISCKKSKSNTNKDDPKTMEVAVYKSNYYPMSLSAKASGVTMTLRNVKFGVSAKQVTFNPEDYPGVTIIDKR